MRKPREPKCRNTNLLKRFDKINLEYFGGHACGGIAWRNFPLGKDASTAGHILQAVCIFDERIIKVNSVMDDVRIPLWYLDFVIYHEMLHLQHGPQQYSENGYAYPHSIRFQCMEQKHPNYKRAVEFEEKKLSRIVRSWRQWREWERTSKQKKQSHLRLAAKRR
jgi:hypothetical protein